MGGMQVALEVVLVGLLGGTLFHALRLERALRVIRRDRAELEALLHGFNQSTRQAESGIEKLRGAVEGAGRQIARQIEAASNLKDELGSLIERGEALADGIDRRARSNWETEPPPPRALFKPEPAITEASGARVRSQAERDLLRALRVSR